MFKTYKHLYFHSSHDKGSFRCWLKVFQIHQQLEVVWLKKVSPGFSFHIGDRGSETPVDVMVSFYWLAFFWGLNFPRLGDICAKLGQGHKRNISLKAHSGQLWWELWHDDDGGYDRHHRDICDQRRKPKIWPWSRYRDKYRSWMCLREGNIELNPLNVLWGARYFHREVLEEKMLWVYIDQFPGDRYDVRFRLEKIMQHREHGPKWVRHKTDRGYAADWFHNPGIPTQNHDWKGDNTLGSGVNIENVENWESEAVQNLITWVKRERERRNYRPRSPEENNE
jgi:hypothetical protein